MDICHKGGGTKEMDSLGHILWLSDTLDQLGNESLNIFVNNQTADLLHCSVGALLDLRFCVPHSLGDNWDKIWYAKGELDWGGDDEGLDAVESNILLLPLLCGEDRVDNGWEDGLDGVGVDSLDNGQSGLAGSVLYWDHLVTDSRENSREENDEVWLNSSRGVGMFSNGLDSIQRTFPCVGILLVAELLLEGFDGPGGANVSKSFLGHGRDATKRNAADEE